MYMHSRLDKKKKTPRILNNIDSGMLTGRLFPVQLKTLSQQPDLKTSLSQAERYGHHLDKIQCAMNKPIQMLELEEEEDKKRIKDTNPNTSELYNNYVLNRFIHFTNNLKGINNSQQKDTNSKQVTNTAGTYEKDKDKKQNQDEYLASPTSKTEQKAIEDSSQSQDPEVKRLLDKQTQDNSTQSSGAQNKNFVAPDSTYDENKSTPSPKVGTRGQYLAKREAMDMLGNNKSFIATQRAVKKPSEKNTSKSEISKAEDSTHKVKLKNAAELVRDQVINEDRQAKEHLLGTLNLDPAIVAKQGGEQIILQKIH